jgi:hypothetical protein
MVKMIVLCFLFLFNMKVFGQENTAIKLGEKEVYWREVHQAENGQWLFINVHEDESTSIEAVSLANEQIMPLNFFRLTHNNTRRIEFLLKDKEYSIDPNRIFTFRGRIKTLKDGGRFSFKANRLAKTLSKEIITTVRNYQTIIAVHNNTDVNYSIHSYAPGGDESGNTSELFITDAWDPDDFIYTTHKAFYDAFKARNINVIYQNDKRFVNDGSLSVYCGKRQIPYINIETQKGHLNEQIKLIQEVLAVLDEVKIAD